ncbi:trypsin-like peptidase domain-containing protein [Trinickia mobilis]|uniref:trypsin-like peptidase domain-containing protein n=1 Tax=Trinickia mobilis TaxID=2816356 RepID=UPI0035ABF3D1
MAQQVFAAMPIDFPAIVERYGPAVVNISAAAPEQQTSAPAAEAVDSDDPFAAFFKRVVPQQPESQRGPPRAIAGSGSGFIISPDGLILTTAHVVDQAAEVTVTLTDRRAFKGRVLTVDTESGVALLQIDATKLPTVKLGDSSRVRVGEQVLTVGSPDSFANAVTDGIISATPRVLPDGSNFPFFQTDVATNPDNSGGPLFNRAGEVIGIDVQIYTNAEPFQSLTFAIPINLANKVRAQLQAQRNGTSGGFGADVQDIGPGLAAALGLPRPAGALVNAVAPGTPAAASGLKAGDVVTQIGPKTIDRSAELVEYAAGLRPGTKTVLRLIRDRRPMAIRLMAGTAGESPAAGQIPEARQIPETKQIPVVKPIPEARQIPETKQIPEVKPIPEAQPIPEAGQNEGGAADRLGLTMHALSEEEKRASDLPLGLMVDEVAGPAASAGIQPGDIVLSFNGELVESQDQASSLEAKAKKQIAVLIQRHNVRRFVSIELR